MLVSPKDGRCQECDSQLQIIDADDATLTVECTECGEVTVVETDAFNDGSVHYWPQFIAERMRKGGAA